MMPSQRVPERQANILLAIACEPRSTDEPLLEIVPAEEVRAMIVVKGKRLLDLFPRDRLI